MCLCLWRTSEVGEDRGARNERVLVEQDGQRSIPSVKVVEVLRDVRCAIPRFLEDYSMEATTGCRDDLSVVLTSWARIPLEHRGAGYW